MKRALLLFTIVVSCVSQELYAQKVAVKTNLLSDAFFSPNLGVEIGFAPRWTLDVSGQFNGWTLSHDRRWKHWQCSRKFAIGYATALADTFSVRIYMADSTTSADSTGKSICWALTSGS